MTELLPGRLPTTSYVLSDILLSDYANLGKRNCALYLLVFLTRRNSRSSGYEENNVYGLLLIANPGSEEELRWRITRRYHRGLDATH